MSSPLSSNYTRHAFLELTSRCNLRCVYCAVSQPDYHGEDFDLSYFESIISELKTRGTLYLNVNGHGETTLIKDWHKLCNPLIAAGMKLILTTNLSRALTDDEIKTLAKFNSIIASCDTVDPELFTNMRRRAKLDILYDNMNRIQAASRKVGRKPYWTWSTVVTDLNVFGLQDLVREGLRKNIDHFSFVGLTKYNPVPDGLRVRSIDELSPENFSEAQRCLAEAKDIVIKAGATIHIQAELQFVISKKEKTTENPSGLNSAKIEKRTRDCFFPWATLFFKSNGEVAPCCWHPAIGKVSETMPLKTILKDEPLKLLRKGLLSGDLPSACRLCPSAKWIPVKKFRSKIKGYRFMLAVSYHSRWILKHHYPRFIKRFFFRILFFFK